MNEESSDVKVFSGLDGSVLHALHGEAANVQLGSSVAGPGGVNGDGFPDLGSFGSARFLGIRTRRGLARRWGRAA